jgi:hypothetical protein
LFKQLPTHQLSLPMTWYTTYHFQPDLNWDLILHKGQPLFFSTTRSHSPSPFNLHVHITLKKVNIPFSNLCDLWWGVKKLKKLAEIFMIDAGILYVLVVKISDFFDFFWNLCAISKVALVVFHAWFRPWWWFHLDLSFIHKINLSKCSF